MVALAEAVGAAFEAVARLALALEGVRVEEELDEHHDRPGHRVDRVARGGRPHFRDFADRERGEDGRDVDVARVVGDEDGRLLEARDAVNPHAAAELQEDPKSQVRQLLEALFDCSHGRGDARPVPRRARALGGADCAASFTLLGLRWCEGCSGPG